MEKVYKKIDLDYINKHYKIPEGFEEDYEKNHIFEMSDDATYIDEKICREHIVCMRDKYGRPKFGAIGGGYSRRFYLRADGGYDIIAKCDGCGKTINLTKLIDKITDDERATDEYKKAVENNRGYNCYRMNEIEYLRYKVFCDERHGDTISIGWMGTGLGWIINVRDEDTAEYADITDIDCW